MHTHLTDAPPHRAVSDRTHLPRPATDRTEPRADLRGEPGVTAPESGRAAVAMALGVAALLTSPVLVGGLLAVVGLILGVAALTATGRTGAGRAAAVTAVVTSSLAIVVAGLATVLLLWYANRTQECYRPDSLHQYAQCVRHHLDAN